MARPHAADAAPLIELPAPLEVPDRLVGRLTVRQCAWLAVAALGLLPLLSGGDLRRALAALLVACALLLALVTPAGRCLEEWLHVGWRYRRRTRARPACARHRRPSRSAGEERPARRPPRRVGLALALSLLAAVAGVGLAARHPARPGTPGRQAFSTPPSPSPEVVTSASPQEIARVFRSFLAALASASPSP